MSLATTILHVKWHTNYQIVAATTKKSSLPLTVRKSQVIQTKSEIPTLKITFCCHMYLKVACCFWPIEQLPLLSSESVESKFSKVEMHSFKSLNCSANLLAALCWFFCILMSWWRKGSGLPICKAYNINTNSQWSRQNDKIQLTSKGCFWNLAIINLFVSKEHRCYATEVVFIGCFPFSNKILMGQRKSSIRISVGKSTLCQQKMLNIIWWMNEPPRFNFILLEAIWYKISN